MNWGYKILIVILLFIAGMGTMLAIAMRQTNELMDEQYYVKELQHQDLIDAAANLSRLNEALLLKDSLQYLCLDIPDAAAGAVTEGHIRFVRPSDQSRDRSFPLQANAKGIQLIAKKELSRGLYRVQIRWQSDHIPYYYDAPVFIQ
jgi:hypothetical protein